MAHKHRTVCSVYLSELLIAKSQQSAVKVMAQSIVSGLQPSANANRKYITFLTFASSAILSPNSWASASWHWAGASRASPGALQKTPAGSSSWRVIRLVRSGVQSCEVAVMVRRPGWARRTIQCENRRVCLEKSSRYTASLGCSSRSPSCLFWPRCCRDCTRKRITSVSWVSGRKGSSNSVDMLGQHTSAG